jgi:histidine triad (HIT) family protein
MAECIFCAIAAGRAPASLIHEDERCLAFLDIYPVRAGHALIVPRRHAVRLADLAPGDGAAVFELATRVAQALRDSELPCDDVNLLLNDGPGANQTVPHLHVHVIPRQGRDLARVLGKLLQRPVAPLLGGRPRAELDRQAAGLRAALATRAKS